MNQHVKKAFLGTSAAALLFSAGCGKDDGEEDLIIGEWGVEESNYNDRLLGNTITYNYTMVFGADGSWGECYEYLSDGVSQYKYCYQDGTWQWKTLNQELTLTINNQAGRANGTSGSFTVTGEVVEIDGDSFVMDLEADFDGDGVADASATWTGTKVGDGISNWGEQ